METVAEKLHALFKRFPHLSDGGHDKELIAMYLEIYHKHVIPPDILRELPSFETIRRTRQYYTAEVEAAATSNAEAQTAFSQGLTVLEAKMKGLGFQIQPAPPMVRVLGGLEPSLYGIKDETSLIGVVRFAQDLLQRKDEVRKLLDLLLWIQQYPGLDRKPILVIVGEVAENERSPIHELRQYGWSIIFA